MNGNEIELVKNGYEKIAKNYRKEKNLAILSMLIFKEWFSMLNGVVLDLGCGSGYPIAQRFAQTNESYLGIDFAKSQIELAKKQFLNKNVQFRIAEMLEFCQQSEDEQYGGIIALHSIFHLPRRLHCDLFLEIKRILKPNTPLLFSVPETADEGSMYEWFGTKMWWSSFTHDWYKKTLNELGFKPLMSYREKTLFLKKEEINWYLLFQV